MTQVLGKIDPIDKKETSTSAETPFISGSFAFSLHPHYIIQIILEIAAPLPSSPTNAQSPQEQKAAQTVQDTRKALMELRRISGLTWDHLAYLFSVKRRTLFFWASGRRMNQKNEKHLWKLLYVIHAADRGFAALNRSLLLKVEGGKSLLDLLAEKRYEEFLELAGKGPGRKRLELGPLSAEEKEARRPLPPDVLAGSLQGPPHKPHGKPRPGKAVKRKNPSPGT